MVRGDAGDAGDPQLRKVRAEVMMASSYVFKVSTNGRVSIPAEARARWRTDRVTIVDLGDRLVIRPLPDDPIASLRGRYRGRGPSTKVADAEARRDDVRRETRRGGPDPL